MFLFQAQQCPFQGVSLNCQRTAFCGQMIPKLFKRCDFAKKFTDM